MRRSMTVEVLVGGDPDVVNDVLELDGNCLVPASTRRDEFNAGLFESLPACLSDDPETRRLDNLL